ncbi:MAG: hypothetical protein AB7S38_22360 [Vulcanimicrobiota bacterium]
MNTVRLPLLVPVVEIAPWRILPDFPIDPFPRDENWRRFWNQATTEFGFGNLRSLGDSLFVELQSLDGQTELAARCAMLCWAKNSTTSLLWRWMAAMFFATPTTMCVGHSVARPCETSKTGGPLELPTRRLRAYISA